MNTAFNLSVKMLSFFAACSGSVTPRVPRRSARWALPVAAEYPADARAGQHAAADRSGCRQIPGRIENLPPGLPVPTPPAAPE